MARIAAAHALYGISRIQLGPSFDSLTVEYDASRLTANEVEAALYRFGIPLAQRC
jgi:allophanate hydrolase subunit 1